MESQYSTGLAKSILFTPLNLGANRLCILASHATPSMVSWLLTTYDEQGISGISVELIVEAVLDDGIDKASHEGFQALHGIRDKRNRFTCSYLFQAPISKKNLFLWLQNDTPVCAFSSSYDFTQTDFLRKHSGSLTRRSASHAYTSYENAVSRSIFCRHSEVEDHVVIRSSTVIPISTSDISADSCVHLSLLTRTGEPGKRSGLNWGQRNKRNKNEAYIPLPSKIARSGFFPLDKQHFLVVTDDHHTLQLRVEQQSDKAITTPTSNAQLGEYFRNRLGLANGAYVHASDLKGYGRTDVTFYKIDDEQYYMDFSPKRGMSPYGR